MIAHAIAAFSARQCVVLDACRLRQVGSEWTGDKVHLPCSVLAPLIGSRTRSLVVCFFQTERGHTSVFAFPDSRFAIPFEIFRFV